VVFRDTVHEILKKLPSERTDDDVEELMNFMQNMSASFAFICSCCCKWCFLFVYDCWQRTSLLQCTVCVCLCV